MKVLGCVLLFVAAEARADLPSEDAKWTAEISVAGGAGNQRTAPLTVGGQARVDTAGGGYVKLWGQGDQGIDQAAEEVVRTLLSTGLGEVEAPSSGHLWSSQAGLGVGWQMGHTKREGGARVRVGTYGIMRSNRAFNNWLYEFRAAMDGFDASMSIGAEAEIGWAWALGEEDRSTLVSAHALLGGDAPIAAWGVPEFWLGREDLLTNAGVRRGAQLHNPFVHGGGRVRVQHDHFVVGAELRVSNRRPPSVTPGADGQTAVRATASAGVVF